MKTKILISLTGLALCIFLVACKKKESDNNNQNTPVKPVNKLCDGIGTNSWYPLKTAYVRTYSYSENTSINPAVGVAGTVEFLSKTYFKLVDASYTMYTNDQYLREDPATHDVYYYNANKYEEYLLVPGSPTLDQTWPFDYHTQKVTNLNASITTSACSYTGLLEITEYSSGTVWVKRYYKKGLGLVAELVFAFGYRDFKLLSVVLE